MAASANKPANAAGLLHKPDTPFVKEAAKLLRTTLTTLKDADLNLRNLLGYPLDHTLGQSEAQEFLKGSLKDVAKSILEVCTHLCFCISLPPVWAFLMWAIDRQWGCCGTIPQYSMAMEGLRLHDLAVQSAGRKSQLQGFLLCLPRLQALCAAK